MIYQPTNEAEEALKEAVFQNVSLKVGKMRNHLMTFPVNQAVWCIFLNQCMWAVLHLSKDDEELRRILKIHEVREIQTIIETVQAQLKHSTCRDSQVFGT